MVGKSRKEEKSWVKWAFVRQPANITENAFQIPNF